MHMAKTTVLSHSGSRYAWFNNTEKLFEDNQKNGQDKQLQQKHGLWYSTLIYFFSRSLNGFERSEPLPEILLCSTVNSRIWRREQGQKAPIAR